MSEIPEAKEIPVWSPYTCLQNPPGPVLSIQGLGPGAVSPGPKLGPEPPGCGRSQVLKDLPCSRHSCAGTAARDGWKRPWGSGASQAAGSEIAVVFT